MSKVKPLYIRDDPNQMEFIIDGISMVKKYTIKPLPKTIRRSTKGKKAKLV